MIKKGMVTQEEAKKVRAEADALRTNGVATGVSSKWRINEAIKSIELFGDLRLRYEDRTAEDPNDAHIHLQRFRYSVRLGLRGEVLDNYYFGVRLDTGANPRSPWVSMGTSTAASPVYQGPFGKSTGGINVGQVYIGGRWGDWLDITLGKMPNPMYTTPMVWDGDLAPEGLAEKLKLTVGRADLFATFGQFLYEDTNPSDYSKGFFGVNNSLFPSQNGGESRMVFMLAWQAGVNYHFTTNVSAKVAPALYSYTSHGVDTTRSLTFAAPGFGGPFVGQGATNGVNGVPAYGWSGYPSGFNAGFNANQTGINDLLVLEVPFEVNFKLGKINTRIFADYAYNLEGQDRAEAAFKASKTAGSPGGFPEPGGVRLIPSAQTADVHAYQFGVAFGNGGLGAVYGTVSKKHTWEVRSYWQHIEQYALDPNLLDSDFFEGRGNLEGIFVALAYCPADNIIATMRYGAARRINSLLGTGGSNQDIPQINPVDHYNLWQIDLTLRF